MSCDEVVRSESSIKLSVRWAATLSDPTVSCGQLLRTQWPQDGETFQVNKIWDMVQLNWETSDYLLLIREVVSLVYLFVYLHSNVSFSFISVLESGMPSCLMGALSSPIGIQRHNISYDENMDAPMHSPPSDLTVNIMWKEPVIPQHRFRKTEVLPHLPLFSNTHRFELVTRTKWSLY